MKNKIEFFLWYLFPFDPYKYCYKKGCFNKLCEQMDLGVLLYYKGNFVTRFRVCEKCYQYFLDKEMEGVERVSHEFRWRK